MQPLPNPSQSENNYFLETNEYQPIFVFQHEQIVNRAARPLLISNVRTNFIISLSYMLEAKVQLVIAPICRNCTLNIQEKDKLSIPKVSHGFSDLFLFKNYPSESWKNELETQQNYKVELLFEGDVLWLWRLEKIA